MNFQGPFLHWIFASWATATCDRPLEISCCLSCLWFDELARSSWQEDYFHWNNIQQHKRSWRSLDLWDGHSPGSAVKRQNGTTALIHGQGVKPRQGENLAWGHAKQDLSPKSPPPNLCRLNFPSKPVESMCLTSHCLQVTTGVTQKSLLKSQQCQRIQLNECLWKAH